MTPVQVGVLYLTMTTLLVVWVRGGHPERLAATVCLIWTTALILEPVSIQFVIIGKVPLFEAAIELALLAFFVWMALKGGRWWPFVASAVTALSVLVYFARAFVPELDRRAEISAHIGLAVALELTLLAGIGERWLAGERPVSENLPWRRVRRAS